MIVWRLCKPKWRATAFSGAGAAENPGRWNSAGVRAVYCAESRALAALEVLAHVEHKPDLQHAKFIVIPVTLPETLVTTLERLPGDWRKTPIPASTRRLGDRFIAEAKTPALRVPSAVVPGEFNFLLNPAHPQFSEITIGSPESFRFDGRVL